MNTQRALSPYEQLFYSDYIGGLSIRGTAKKRGVGISEALETRQRILGKGWELPKIDARISDRTKILCGAPKYVTRCPFCGSIENHGSICDWCHNSINIEIESEDNRND